VNIHSLYGFFARRFRPARMKMFRDRLEPGPTTRILDLGGTVAFWEGTDLAVTVLNLGPQPDEVPSGVTYVQGDATDVPFSDRAFDIVFSNSMIEHLHTRERQEKVASEALRVGTTVWVQTPNRWFPLEPHYLTPFIHWLPEGIRRRLVRNFTVWGWITRPTRERADAMVEEVRLLTIEEMRTLFPECEIERERYLRMTKSLIAIGRAASEPG
jgi:SAM-dependent methyltransferase